MGLSSTLYLGPYATCQAKPFMKMVKIRACPAGKACKKPKPKGMWDSVAEAFCSTCGTPIVETNAQIKSRPSPYEALKGERLTPVFDASDKNHRVYFVINEGLGMPREFSFDKPSHLSPTGGCSGRNPVVYREVRLRVERAY